MTEVWKEIPNFPGYEVSDLGRVRCWRPWGFRRVTGEPRIVKAKGHGTKRYLAVVLGYRGPTKEIHRLVAELFVPGRSPGLDAAHQNGNKHDNRAANLRWKTRQENVGDKRRHGTWGRKLSIDDVREIRRLYATGQFTQVEVGTMFGITQGTVGKIVRHVSWQEAA